jgi:chromosome segregation ATPase
MGEDQSQTGRRRLTVAEASEILGVTVEAVRGRIKRGTLEHERDSGAVYVLLDADQPATGRQPGDDQPTDQARPGAHEELADELRNRIRYLERQVVEEREARRRADTLLAQLMQRIPELEAPASSSESRESDVSPGPTGELRELREELDTERTRREMAESTLRKGMDEERRRREEAERERDDLRREQFARSEPRESPQMVEEEPQRAEPHSATGGAQESIQRPWWRRFFGG